MDSTPEPSTTTNTTKITSETSDTSVPPSENEDYVASDLDLDLDSEWDPRGIMSPGPGLPSYIGTADQHRHQMLSNIQTERLRRYLDDQTLKIVQGYVQRVYGQGFADITKLVDALIALTDVLWYSLQSTDHAGGRFEVYYLLKLADEFSDQLYGYFKDDAAAVRGNVKPVLRMLQRFDDIFEALLVEPSRRILSQTDRVRLNSIATRSRVVAVKCFEGVGGYELSVSKVYEKTLESIGL